MASETDIIFARAGEMDLKLDIFRPEGAGQRTAIIYLHGGGWRGGSRETMRPLATLMAEHGYVGLPAQYRLTGQSPWPAQIHDVKAAIRWTRANAERLGVDADRIVLWGSSAGAHLSLLAAGTGDDPAFEGEVGTPGVSSAVDAVIAVHPPVRLVHESEDQRLGQPGTGLLGESFTPEAAAHASPINYVTADFPPTLLLHGTQDRLVHHSASQQMLDALRAVRSPADLHLFHGHDHGFAGLPSMRELITAEAAYFLDRALVDPAKYKAEVDKFSMFAAARRPDASAPAG
jgi:acetyl esterase/lipase